jgi:hypothetical protein
MSPAQVDMTLVHLYGERATVVIILTSGVLWTLGMVTAVARYHVILPLKAWKLRSSSKNERNQ